MHKKKDYLPNFFLGIIVLNNREARLYKNFKTLPDCLNVVIYPTLDIVIRVNQERTIKFAYLVKLTLNIKSSSYLSNLIPT